MGLTHMDTTVCHESMADMAVELGSIPLVRVPNGSGSSHYGGPERWINGLSMTRIRLGDTYPLATRAVEELQERRGLGDVVQVLVNKLEAGGDLGAHRDGPPDHPRYHLPVVTHDLAYWWDEIEGRRHMIKGWWYGPVPYCGILHAAANPSPVDRLHLVVDFMK